MSKVGCAIRVLAVLPAIAVVISSATLAQDYPARELHSIVNFPPGAGMDIMIRYYATQLGELAGKPVVVENKPGAQGLIATEYLARSKPDGYTFMITPASATLAAAPAMFKQLAFDPLKDVRPVMSLSKLGFVFAVDARKQISSMSELTADLKQKSGNGSYGTVADTGIVSAELYKNKTGLETMQVMYKGNSELMTDLYGGQIDYVVLSPTALVEPARAGKIRILAITTATRFAAIPDVPTMQQAGFAGFDVTPWIGLVVAAKTPDPIVSVLAAWHRKINETPQTKAMLTKFGMEPLEEDGEAMSRRLVADTAKWAELIRIGKIAKQ